MPKTIGKYRIEGEIGHGGFGTVYRAWDPTVGRAVAIKVLTVPGDDDLLTRFRNEAAAQGNLHHPNIVTVHDFGEHNGTPYMVMQLLEGHTLQEVLTRKTPLTLIEKMNIMGQVAQGLHHAHLHGIIHRDVKPPNIMMLPDGSVQIMDFGIARLTASTSRQTRTGFVVGTVLYMAPEQFLPDKTVDHRADIWAFGAIYYELLTGKHPFAAAEEMSVLYRIAHAEPESLRSVAAHWPPALDDVIARLLAKDPDLRYQSLRDVQFDLQPILLDLKHERATEMVAAARQLQSDGRIEEAQAAAQEILELDPSNREAHALLRAVKERIQRKLVQPKVTSLVQKAEQNVQARAWQLAIDALESAVRLSNSDPAIHSRLQQVKKQYEISQKAEKLVVDAKRELRAENYTAAFRIATEAAQADPGNASASHLLSQIQREIDIRESHRKLEAGIGRARGKLLLQQYDEAIRELNALAALWPDNPTLAELLSSGHREKVQAEKLERRRRELAAIRIALKEDRFDEASSRLELLLKEYPGDAEITQLLRFAHEERASQQRAQAIDRIKADAERLTSGGQFDAAIVLLEGALREYPGDPAFAPLLQSVTLVRTEYESQQRTEAIRTVLQRAVQCERNGDAVGALRIVEHGLVAFPEAEVLTSAAVRIRQSGEQQQRTDAISRRVTDIENALAAQEFNQALRLIEAARREFIDERVFDQLASKASEARNAFELDLARRRLRQEIDAGRIDVALELVPVALKRFPSDRQLLAMEHEARIIADQGKPGAVIAAGVTGAAAAPATGTSESLGSTGADPTSAPAPQTELRRRSLTRLAVGTGVLLLGAAGALIMHRSGSPLKAPPQATTDHPPALAPKRAPQQSVGPPQVAPPALSAATRNASVQPRKPAAVKDVETADDPVSASEGPVNSPPQPTRPANAVAADNTGRVGAAPEISPASGNSSGKLVWSGQLSPGERVVLTAPKGSMLRFTEIDQTSIVPYGRVSVVEVAESGLTIANVSALPVTSVEISWRLKARQ